MVYPDYRTHCSFYGHPILAFPRQYYSTHKNSFYHGVHDWLFANCRVGSVFWKFDDNLGIKQMLGGLDAGRLGCLRGGIILCLQVF